MLLVCNTYRYRAHSMYDAELYRTKDEVEQWKQRDPIETFATWAMNCGLLTASALDEINARVDAEIAQAVAFAKSGHLEPVTMLERFTYAEGNHE